MSIIREFPDILSAWHGVVRELAYKDPDAINWGMHAAYPDCLEIRIKDALKDMGDFGDSSYTKVRWTSFLRKYLRPDYASWIDESVKRLQLNPHRPYVASYQMNIPRGKPPKKVAGVRNFSGGPREHSYGNCLEAMNLRIKPHNTVILKSRACALDKTGFLDLALIHLTAKRMGFKQVSAVWFMSLGFISAISQIYYTHRFDLPLEGHKLGKRVKHLVDGDNDHNYGPLKRIFKRKREINELGRIPGACLVRDLPLEFKTLDK